MHIFHKWGNWTPCDVVQNWMVLAGYYDTIKGQERYCLKCNKRQLSA